jgi:plastocyanin
MRSSRLARIGVLAALAGVAACGGGGSESPTTPSGSSTPPPSTAITIVGDRGNLSFAPNPGSAPGGMASWRNTDNQVHRIRSNDGSFDTGDIAPGQTSAPRAAPAAGMNYHCPIHPGMIGAINADTGPPPPCTGIYC